MCLYLLKLNCDQRTSGNRHIAMSVFALALSLARLLLVLTISLGTLVLALTLSLILTEKTALPRLPIQAADSTEIVLLADVQNWEPIFPDGHLDAASRDRLINVVDDVVIIGEHNWILSFTVAKVVKGEFPSKELHVLLHSPSQFGVRKPGQRFTLIIRRHPGRPQVIASSERRLSEGLSYFTISEPLYSIVSSDPGSQ